MKLSPYTIAKNCTDLADVECGIAELKPIVMEYVPQSGKINRNVILKRYAKLIGKKHQLLHPSNPVK